MTAGQRLTGFLLALALFGAALSATAQELPRKLPPVEEASADASWANFRRRLLGAVEKRDRKFLLSIIDPKVRNQTEDTRGIAEFRRQWDLDSNDSPLWLELPSALKLGGGWMTRDDGQREYCAPYVMARWPDDVDPVGHGAVLVRETLVQAEATAFSPVIGRLSYDIVPVTDWEVADKAVDVKQRWVELRLGDRKGYIPEEHIRSPMEHAACFVKTRSGWRLTAFAPAGGE